MLARLMSEGHGFVPPPSVPNAPKVLSGDDVGFRADGVDRDGKVTGEWMVRINGEWHEARSSMRARPATQ